MELIKIAQIVIACLLIISILLQSKGAGLGGVFGGGGDIYMAKRGFEKKIFNFTIILSVIFLALSLYIVVAS